MESWVQPSWWVRESGRITGPFEHAALEQRIERGEVGPDALVARTETGEPPSEGWMALSEAEGLRSPGRSGEASSGHGEQAGGTGADAAEPSGSAAAMRFDGRLLHWHGETRELFRIFFDSLARTLLTLGVYYFWGKTRIRRYVWSNVSLGPSLADRLEYRGTGRELFRAWTVAFLPVLLVVVGIGAWLWSSLPAPAPSRDPGRAPGAAEAGPSPGLTVGMMLLFVVGTPLAFLLLDAAKFAARRYVLTRTRWRSIRFSQTGSVWAKARHTLANRFKVAVTFNLLYPHLEEAKRRVTIGATRLGDRELSYVGNGQALHNRWGLAILGIIGGGLLVAVLTGLVIFALFASGTVRETSSAMRYAVGWSNDLLTGLVFFFFWTFYRAGSMAHAAQYVELPGLEFHFAPGLWKLFRLKLVNLLALVGTLGLAFPWVKVRNIRFTAEHLQAFGEIDPAAIEAPADDRSEGTEGAAETLGLEFPVVGVVRV